MKQFACRYTIVQFLPYSETGEFANVGVVLACPETGFFDFQLQTRRCARITAFFDELDAKVYRTAIQTMQMELERIQAAVRAVPVTPERADTVRNLLTHLTHPREAIVRFSPVRPLLTPEPATALQQRFERYVNRAFVTPEYTEGTMTKRLQNLLAGLSLPAPFKAVPIGDGQIHTEFPLVQRRDDQITKVIKPLNLAQNKPNQIFDHGDVWLQKVRRLRKRNLLPPDVLFAVAAPPETEVLRFDAYREICMELQQSKVLVAEQNNEQEIVAFAMD